MDIETITGLMRSMMQNGYNDYIRERATIYMDAFALPLTDSKRTEEIYEDLKEAIKNGESLYPRFNPFKSINDQIDTTDDKVKEQLMHVINQVRVDDGFLMFSPETVTATSVNRAIGSPIFIMQALIGLEPAGTTWKVKVNFELDGDIVRTIEEFITQKTFKRVESQVVTSLTVGED